MADTSEIKNLLSRYEHETFNLMAAYDEINLNRDYNLDKNEILSEKLIGSTESYRKIKEECYSRIQEIMENEELLKWFAEIEDRSNRHLAELEVRNNIELMDEAMKDQQLKIRDDVISQGKNFEAYKFLKDDLDENESETREDASEFFEQSFEEFQDDLDN